MYLKYLFGAKKFAADPLQQELAQIIIDVAEDRRRPNDILSFVLNQGWSRSDQGNRLAHATNMARVWRGDLYPQMKELYRQIYAIL